MAIKTNYLEVLNKSLSEIKLPPGIKDIGFAENLVTRGVNIHIMFSTSGFHNLHFTREYLQDNITGVVDDINRWVNQFIYAQKPPTLDSLHDSAQDATEERLKEIIAQKEAGPIQLVHNNLLTSSEAWTLYPQAWNDYQGWLERHTRVQGHFPDAQQQETMQRAALQERERQMQLQLRRLQAEQQIAVPSLFLADPKYAPYGASYQILENQIIDNQMLSQGHVPLFPPAIWNGETEKGGSHGTGTGSTGSK